MANEHPTSPPTSLAEFVVLARAQPLPTLRIAGEDIARGVAQRRAARGRVVVVTMVLAAAAAWLLWTRVVPALGDRTEARPLDQASRVVDDTGASGQAVPRAAQPVVTPTMPEATPEAAVVPVSPAVEPSGPEPAVEVPTPATSSNPTAAELAREAERAMAQGRRNDAIGILETLVRKYPTHATAKAALMDLGRLLRGAGRKDEARCAYQLLARRWPADPARDEVDRVLELLGEGPRCRGLRPKGR